MGGKTLHRERGDRCRRETGCMRCSKRQREKKERDISRDSKRDVEKEIRK